MSETKWAPYVPGQPARILTEPRDDEPLDEPGWAVAAIVGSMSPIAAVLVELAGRFPSGPDAAAVRGALEAQCPECLHLVSEHDGDCSNYLDVPAPGFEVGQHVEYRHSDTSKTWHPGKVTAVYSKRLELQYERITCKAGILSVPLKWIRHVEEPDACGHVHRGPVKCDPEANRLVDEFERAGPETGTTCEQCGLAIFAGRVCRTCDPPKPETRAFEVGDKVEHVNDGSVGKVIAARPGELVVVRWHLARGEVVSDHHLDHIRPLTTNPSLGSVHSPAPGDEKRGDTIDFGGERYVCTKTEPSTWTKVL